MHTCEFCHTEYNPRPQVKNPRACNKDICQKRRQASNERQWRKINNHLDSKEYHQIRRKQRLEKIKKIILAFIKSLTIGIRFQGLPINIELFSDFFEKTFLGLGLRKINKFWTIDLMNNFEMVEFDI